jgi:SAM-dependent methyltransferase
VRKQIRRLLDPMRKPRSPFLGSANYWEQRYATGGNSGVGSYGEQALYKSAFLNRFVVEHNVSTVVELGCGDGNQLTYARYPRYLGMDVSKTSVAVCIERFRDDPSKSFLFYADDFFSDPAGFISGDLAISLDVIFHLVEDDVFDHYMRRLFRVARLYVVIYATDGEVADTHDHVRHRGFTAWIEANTDWQLRETFRRPEPHYQDFFVYVPAK